MISAPGCRRSSYLRQLPVTMLKIDGSFVRDILKDARSESMVQAIAQLARSMSISTVAEYVETDEIRAPRCGARRRLRPGIRHRQAAAAQRVLAELPMIAAAAPVTCNGDEDCRPASREPMRADRSTVRVQRAWQAHY